MSDEGVGKRVGAGGCSVGSQKRGVQGVEAGGAVFRGGQQLQHQKAAFGRSVHNELVHAAEVCLVAAEETSVVGDFGFPKFGVPKSGFARQKEGERLKVFGNAVEAGKFVG